MKSRLLYNILLLLGIFLISVIVRLPNYGKPLGRSHEWITAHTLITLRVWKEEGISKHHYAPVYTLPGASNKNIDMLGGVTSPAGNNYYISYPPFAFIWANCFLNFFDLDLVPASLELLNLLIHLLCALGVFGILNQLFRRSIKRDFCVFSILGFGLYTFASGNLWYHMNTYFCDILEQFFFIAGIWLYLRIRSKNVPGTTLYSVYAICCFLAIYTEWLGVFMCGVIGLNELVGIRRRKHNAHLFWITAGASVFALLLILWQYISIAGFKELYEALRYKYVLRSGLGSVAQSDHGYNFANPASYGVLKQRLVVNYWAMINLLILISIAFVPLVLYQKKYFINRREAGLLALIGIPVLLHHLVFFNFNVVHHFATLKTFLLLLFLLIILANKLLLFVTSRWPRYRLAGLAAISILFGMKCYDSVLIYYQDHNPKDVMLGYQQMGEEIKNRAVPGYFVFSSAQVCPELVYYANRNIAFADNIESAQQRMHDEHIKEAYYYDIRDDKIVHVSHLSEGGRVEEIRP